MYIMEFHDKLQYLMTLTNMTNSTLAKHTSLDASHISRLKNGSRKPVSGAGYLQRMAGCFAKNLKEEYQINALKEALRSDWGIEPALDDLSSILLQWLDGNVVGKTGNMDHFLHRFSSFSFDQNPKRPSSASVVPDAEPIQFHYGIQGKRDAVIEFLSQVIHTKKPVPLLLYSDENMSWLTEDLSFTAKWASLLQEVILLGCKIKIIHNINRDLDELLSAIGRWLPLYMTGSIEPYYYPKVKDGVFKRTLFVAPSVSALVSTSVGSQENAAANMLLHDPDAVASFQKEYESYLARCRPLMTILTKKDQPACIGLLLNFDKHESNTILMNNGLSLVTLPEKMVASWMRRYHGSIRDDLLEIHQQRIRSFHDTTSNHTFTEILHLPDINEWNEKKIPILFGDIFDLPEIYYSKEEYLEHLRHIIHILETVPNYHVHLTETQIGGDFSLYVKENTGAIVAKSGPSSVVFALNEPYLTAAFWDYLQTKFQRIRTDPKSRETVLNTLKKYVGVN
ncbi:hypothetical protein J0B03_08410 [Alkalibacter rhizosphaerae]|uniref:Uncharacterized protein n=1 Tax=Alkalibacter rhizosphaerae TaxID=2815577 RepID=A0A974XKV9_9FIRM|nr:hypothetical protein [Alkalibacter rhizosphaerae]QSX07831.1 hypothetical protein J0B03_08410 [Alkalibacter rhizosphaerae]